MLSLTAVAAILSAAFSAACVNDGANPVGASPVGGSTANVTRFAANSNGVAGEKISLCHATGSKRYVQIYVSVAAVPAHRAHGDGATGQSVPEQPGYIFDSNCIPISSFITYRAEGVLSTSPHPSVPAGAAYVFLLTFDPLRLTSSPDPVGGLQYGFATGVLTIAGASLNGNNLTISIDDRTGESDRVRINGIGLSGDFSANVRFNFVGEETLFGSNAFPIPFPTLVDFPLVQQIVLNTSTTNIGSVTVFQPQQ